MSRLRIHLYMPCWNEAALLPHVFRHYGFVDRFVVFDNGSTDGSRDLIAAEPRAELREFDTGGTIDEREYLRIKNEAWKESRGTADFVIVCDADEFLHHPRIERLLGVMKEDGGTILKPAGYDMVADRVPGATENLLEAVPRGARGYDFDKCVLFDPVAIEEIGYGVGAHICTPRGRVRYFGRPGLSLLHYKYLGLDYVRRRFQAAAARLGPFNRTHGFGAGYGEDKAATKWRLRRVAAVAARVVPPPGEDPDLETREPDDLDASFAEGLALREAKDWHGARAAFARVLAYRPGDVESLGNLASVLRRLALANEAGWCFRQALALAPHRYENWFNYGCLLLANREDKLAEHCFRTAATLRPDFAAAWRQLAAARRRIGDPAGAAEASERAAALKAGAVRQAAAG